MIAGLGALAFMANQIGSSLGWQIMGAISLIAIGAVCFNMGPEIPAVRLVVDNRESQRSPLDWRIVVAYGAMGIGDIIPAIFLPVMAREIVQSPSTVILVTLPAPKAAKAWAETKRTQEKCTVTVIQKNTLSP